MIDRKNLYDLVALTLSVCFIMTSTGCKQARGARQGLEKPAREINNEPEQVWGVQIKGVRLSAGGYMLDFRYKIVDPNKAAPLMDSAIKPYIVDEKTGSKFIVPTPPKVGSLRQKTHEPIPGRTYFVMFANPGRFLKHGDLVTVVIGDFKAQNLTVE